MASFEGFPADFPRFSRELRALRVRGGLRHESFYVMEEASARLLRSAEPVTRVSAAFRTPAPLNPIVRDALGRPFED